MTDRQKKKNLTANATKAATIKISRRRKKLAERKNASSEISKVKPVPPNLVQNLRANIGGDVAVSASRVDHIWERHGCMENAQLQKEFKFGLERMPSHFRSLLIMEIVIPSTVIRPNWTRSSTTNVRGEAQFQKPGFKIGGVKRFRGSKYRKNLNKHKPRQKYVRTLHFKLFSKPIGFSGVGYGSKAHRNIENLESCCCCAVVQPKMGLITSFPILTADAHNRGGGEKKKHRNDVSSLTTSSYSMSDSEETKGARSVTDKNSQEKKAVGKEVVDQNSTVQESIDKESAIEETLDKDTSSTNGENTQTTNSLHVKEENEASAVTSDESEET